MSFDEKQRRRDRWNRKRHHRSKNKMRSLDRNQRKRSQHEDLPDYDWEFEERRGIEDVKN